MGNLYFLIGLPRSGKSTFAKNWQRTHIDILCDNTTEENKAPFMDFNRVVVNADSIRLALSGNRWNYLTEPFVHAIKTTMTRTLISQDYKVLIDGTHTTTKSIGELFDIDNYAHYHIVNCDKDICIQRAKDSGQSDLEPVIERMAKQLELLTPQKIEEIRQNSIKNKGLQRIV